MNITASRLDVADGKTTCPNCEHPMDPERVKWINTLGSDHPRKAFYDCRDCGTHTAIAFTEEQP